MIDADLRADSLLRRAQVIALIVGVVGVLALVLGAVLDPSQFFRSYLLGWTYWLGLSLGCLGVLMLQHLSGGIWGKTIRRFLEAGAANVPLMAVLFVPLAFGLHALYPWTNHDLVQASELLHQKQVYLNVPFFLVRIALYFVVWFVLQMLLRRYSRRVDATASAHALGRLTSVSAAGMILYFLTVTLASVDLIMSLEPEWYSSIFGALVGAGMFLSAFALCIILLTWLTVRGPLGQVLSAEHFHDLGKLLLAFVIFWTYLAFSQFLIIWAGNLPTEISWYVRRLGGGWQWIGLALIVFQFALPFLLLLSRDLKRVARSLVIVAGIVVAAQMGNMTWLIVPSFYGSGFRLHWMDIAAPIAVGGLWLALMLRTLSRSPLLPLNILPVHHPRAPHVTTELEHA